MKHLPPVQWNKMHPLTSVEFEHSTIYLFGNSNDDDDDVTM